MTSLVERLDGVVHYAIQSHPDQSVHRHVLQTILWLADVMHFKSFFVPVTWARRHRLVDGIPTADGLDVAVERLIAKGLIRKTPRLLSRSPGIHYQSTGMPDIRYLSSRSLVTLGDVTQALQACTARQARKAPLNTVWRTWAKPDDIPLVLAADLSAANASTVTEDNWMPIEIRKGLMTEQFEVGRQPAMPRLTELPAES